MRLIGQEVDALAEHQLNEFAGERLLTGLALKCRSRPLTAIDERQLRNVLSLPQSGRVCTIMRRRKRATAMASDRT